MNLQTLLDERDIAYRLGLFSRFIDARQWEKIGDVFSEDLTFNYGDDIERAGLNALQTMFSSFLSKCGPTQHLLGSLLIDVTGDTAVSQCYVMARHEGLDHLTGHCIDYSGEYVDQWRRQQNGWRIIRRETRRILFLQSDMTVFHSHQLLGK